MDVSYIPIAEARGFTTHWISKRIVKVNYLQKHRFMGKDLQCLPFFIVIIDISKYSFLLKLNKIILFLNKNLEIYCKFCIVDI